MTINRLVLSMTVCPPKVIKVEILWARMRNRFENFSSNQRVPRIINLTERQGNCVATCNICCYQTMQQQQEEDFIDCNFYNVYIDIIKFCRQDHHEVGTRLDCTRIYLIASSMQLPEYRFCQYYTLYRMRSTEKSRPDIAYTERFSNVSTSDFHFLCSIFFVQY